MDDFFGGNGNLFDLMVMMNGMFGLLMEEEVKLFDEIEIFVCDEC